MSPLGRAGFSLCVYDGVLSLQQHRKVLDKGKPDDIMAAVKGGKVREKRSPGATSLTGHLDPSCCCAHRNDYPQCLYPECSTSPEGKSDSRSSWSRISCGSGLKVGLNTGTVRHRAFC